MSDNEYANEKLVWIAHRLEILDEVDKKVTRNEKNGKMCFG